MSNRRSEVTQLAADRVTRWRPFHRTLLAQVEEMVVCRWKKFNGEFVGTVVGKIVAQGFQMI